MEKPFLTLQEIADLLGVEYAWVREMAATSQERRAKGLPYLPAVRDGSGWWVRREDWIAVEADLRALRRGRPKRKD